MSRREAVSGALDRLAPGVPRFEREAILDHALDSPGLRGAVPEKAAWLSMVAYIRHVLTDYDALLADGYDVDSARWFVAGDIDDVLEAWRSPRRLSPDDDPA
ncbi:MAG: DUF2293 domain-containing protein [Salinarimonadaceae bacterium]|nr:MAG: DUF2293 domain-containing protein [Salinarimonadaceae bacterium]